MNLDFVRNPRLNALIMVTIGGAATALVLAIGGLKAGGSTGGKALMLVGIGGIAIGLGAVQLVWPPPPRTDDRDLRNFFTRASLPQKILYVLGGLVGLVVASTLIAQNLPHG